MGVGGAGVGGGGVEDEDGGEVDEDEDEDEEDGVEDEEVVEGLTEEVRSSEEREGGRGESQSRERKATWKLMSWSDSPLRVRVVRGEEV